MPLTSVLAVHLLLALLVAPSTTAVVGVRTTGVDEVRRRAEAGEAEALRWFRLVRDR